MRYEEYSQKAKQRYAEATLQDRKSCLRLFDVYLAGCYTDGLDGIRSSLVENDDAVS